MLRRLRLASTSRELRQWSVDHCHDLWRDVVLSLVGGSYANPASWAGVQWLQKHAAHIRDLTLVIGQVSDLTCTEP